MEFKAGQRVWLKDDECDALVLTVDESDHTYRVWIENEGTADWEWVSESTVGRPPEGFGPAVILGAVRDGAEAARLRISGWRMYYANTSQRRKEQPVTEGFLDYFPAAARLVAELSRLGNEKHNPGQPMHWARDKSKDHRDCVVRHVMDADEIDPETDLAEAVSAVWRACAYLQLLAEEKYGWPKAPRAR